MIETMREAVLPDTPEFVIKNYATLAERAKTRSFGLIEEDVIILDTETTGISMKNDKLIEISAARLQGRDVVETFDTFVNPGRLIPPEITQLTSITNADVYRAPSAEEAVARLVEFTGGCPIIAHNATFDRTFIEAVRGGDQASEIWIDSLALSRIALPRLKSHKLASMAELFGCHGVSHRSCDDVAALGEVWRILLCALSDLPKGLCKRMADMHPDVAWEYRPLFSYLAMEDPQAPFSLKEARLEVIRAARERERADARDLQSIVMPPRDEVADAFRKGGVVSRMYEDYEPRAEQREMACEVRDALATSTHRVIEAGTGVGKSIAYLIPFAEAARRNNITLGISTKSNNLADQLVNHELPKLAEQMEGGLSYSILKGYDHYPCLRKLEQLTRSQEIHTTRDPADTLTAIAVIYAYVCQSPAGDLDYLGIKWKSVERDDLTTTARECAKRLCPFYPDACLIHGARRRAATSDIVVTNHSLLLRNALAEGNILPPIRHWVIDEAHAFEGEARRQWAVSVSADESKAVFERLGGERTGALGNLTHALASSDAATLYLGAGAKAVAAVQRASLAMSEVFEGLRALPRASQGKMGYDQANVWISRELRETGAWQEFLGVASPALDDLVDADRKVKVLCETVAQEHPELVVELANSERRLGELARSLDLVLKGEDENYVYSYQVNLRRKAGGETLTAERLDIGQTLAESWLPEVQTAIFTSATLAVAGRFDHFVHAMGLDCLERGAYKALSLESSYDYEKQMAIVVAGDVPDPRNRAAYLDAMEELLVSVHLAMGGSTLTLFTNRRDMEELFERVEPQVAKAGLELNCQLRITSVKQVRDRFIAEKTSSLFALKAFWEGFDASGETLRCVVIPKLPFSNPNDPLSLERSLREERAWARYALPDAVLEVKQAAGRLIRSSTDRGVLVLADSRLVTKGYGKQFLKSLPTGYQRIDCARVGNYLKLWRKSHEKKR